MGVSERWARTRVGSNVIVQVCVRSTTSASPVARVSLALCSRTRSRDFRLSLSVILFVLDAFPRDTTERKFGPFPLNLPL